MAHPTSASAHPPAVRWLPTGAEAYRRMLPAIAAAKHSIRFEMYIYRADASGESFRAALTHAARRGVRVQLLLDGLGAGGLSAGYWAELHAGGGEVHIFNPLSVRGFLFRDHRKLLLIDDTVAFIGGFNIADEYNGDGVTHGWRDLGWEIHRPDAVQQLAAAFDGMFRAYDLHHRLLHRIRRPLQRANPHHPHGPVLLGAPRLMRNPFRVSLREALRNAQNVQLISGYFVPNFRLRRALRRVARRGGNVEIILAGKSDVPIAQRAARALYGSLLRAGVKIYEYQPQILHAKLAVVDDVVFAGSANLDIRSFGINYEVMVRVDDPQLAAGARDIFAADRSRSVEITRQGWRTSQSWFTRLRGHWAVFFFTKIDPCLVRLQLRGLS
jgi:cardiolipin synthase